MHQAEYWIIPRQFLCKLATPAEPSFARWMSLRCHLTLTVIDNSLHPQQQQPRNLQLKLFDSLVHKKKNQLGLNQL